MMEKQTTMVIDGGVTRSGKRYNDGKSPKGRLVRYLNVNGTDGDRRMANFTLKEGQVLEVAEIYVDSCVSYVEFGAYPNELFNTVMFEDVEAGNNLE